MTIASGGAQKAQRMKHLAILTLALLCVGGAGAQETPLTPRTLQAALATKPAGADAEKLAERIRAYYGRDNLPKGPGVKTDELTAAWALETTAGNPRVVSLTSDYTLPLTRLGTTNVYAATATLPEGTGMLWQYEAGGQRIGNPLQLEVYRNNPDTVAQAGVPKGEVRQMPRFQSNVFAGTSRDWWVYVPAQYKPENPACVMVWQDGGGARNYVPAVYDNLIAKGEVPITVNVFINPGTFEGGRSNRSFEYDTLSDQYARFLLEEILPEVEKTVKLRKDAQSRAIAGLSSGGICAFTAAWERPNEFSKVLSWIGSFTNIQSGQSRREGGHNYPALIRKTDAKPIRVFLQEGSNDLDNIHGNWPLANLQMAKALEFKKYDYKFVYGQGFHSDRHGRAILPDTLRWLWRDYKP